MHKSVINSLERKERVCLLRMGMSGSDLLNTMRFWTFAEIKEITLGEKSGANLRSELSFRKNII